MSVSPERSRDGRLRRRIIWLIVAIAAGIVLAHLKAYMLTDAVVGKLCEASDACAPEQDRDRGVGVFGLIGVLSYLYYPLSLAALLFVPKQPWPLALALASFVLAPVGLGLDLAGLGILAFMTMFFVMAALSEIFGICLLFAVLHSALALLCWGELREEDPSRA